MEPLIWREGLSGYKYNRSPSTKGMPSWQEKLNSIFSFRQVIALILILNRLNENGTLTEIFNVSF